MQRNTTFFTSLLRPPRPPRLSTPLATSARRMQTTRSAPNRSAAAVPPAAAAAGGGGGTAAATTEQQPQRQAAVQWRTCRRCKQQFDPAANGPNSCRFHSAMWTGGEVSKAYGFCRQSAKPEHQLGVVMGRTGLVRFWDCCGSEVEDTPGCCTGRHITYDDPDD